jgi:hypothetical protein
MATNWRKYVADGSARRVGPALMFICPVLTTEQWLGEVRAKGLG